MKLEADSLLSLEKDSHCGKREESLKSRLLADWKIKESIATYWLLVTGSDMDEAIIKRMLILKGLLSVT